MSALRVPLAVCVPCALAVCIVGAVAVAYDADATSLTDSADEPARAAAASAATTQAGTADTSTPSPETAASQVAETESVFLDLMDAAGAMLAIDAGSYETYQGRDFVAWQAQFRDLRTVFDVRAELLGTAKLDPGDAAAVAAMRKSIEALEVPEDATATAAAIGAAVTAQAGPKNEPICSDARRTDLDYAGLRAVLTACFVEIGNVLRFEGSTVDRGTALELLHVTEESGRRKALFDAFRPLWVALDGDGSAASPYRRMIAMAAAEAAQGRSEVEAAANAIGVTTTEVERWLVAILEEWRKESGPAKVAPWDYRYSVGEANRRFEARIPRDALVPANERFYGELGADLKRLGIVYDLAPRPDKSPYAYADFLTRGRMVDGTWRPSIARVVGTYTQGGLFSLNELVHENGHAVHIAAIRNRPAFMDWPDTLFDEAFADVPSWSVYEPAWQRRYLGAEVAEPVAMRALYGTVMLDVAWALFEIRMLREPQANPNEVWTDITSRYLGIEPHPEVPWWAMRVQLVSDPGYMVNYGLGAVLTAEMREKVAASIGAFDAGNAAWYGWLGSRLLAYGSERDTKSLMLSLLGRPVSPDALLRQIRRCGSQRSGGSSPPASASAGAASDEVAWTSGASQPR